MGKYDGLARIIVQNVGGNRDAVIGQDFVYGYALSDELWIYPKDIWG